MRIIYLFVVTGLMSAAGCEKKAEEPPARAATAGEDWAARAAGITSGQRRAEVEAQLPIYHPGPMKRTVKEHSHEVIYWVDEQWKVIVEYDFTGRTTNQAGKITFDHPENKVITPPRLERQYL